MRATGGYEYGEFNAQGKIRLMVNGTRADDARRIMFTGGGTAGHVTPLLAVLNSLNRRIPGLLSSWVGSDRIEARIVPAAGVDFRRIDIRFSYRRPTPDNWGYFRKHILPLIMGHPFRQGLAAVDAFTPQLVVAAGGYVSAPVIWAAQHRGIPVALIEINDPPGLVNWFFAAYAWHVYCATHSIAEQFVTRCSTQKVSTPGFPAVQPKRMRVRICQDLGIDPSQRIVVVMGGSLGAGAIHQLLGELHTAAAVSDDPRWQKLTVLSIAGERPELRNVEHGTAITESPVTHISLDYIDDVPSILAAGDFYIGRSGAATVGELIACGIPSLLIPDPQHADRQQFGNAKALVQRGQGTVIEQCDVTGVAVLDWLRDKWSQARYAIPHPATADIIADSLIAAWDSE